MELEIMNILKREMPILFVGAHPLKITAILCFIEEVRNRTSRQKIVEILDIAYEFGAQYEEIEEIIHLINRCAVINNFIRNEELVGV